MSLTGVDPGLLSLGVVVEEETWYLLVLMMTLHAETSDVAGVGVIFGLPCDADASKVTVCSML